MPPNILVIVGDDMGKEQFSVEGAAGALPGYPALDTIQGIGGRGGRYTRFYTTPFCSPTRACLMTGRYAGRTGLGDIVETDDDEPLFEGEFTLPELIKEYTGGQYACGVIGKYHLGNAQNGGLMAPNFHGWDYSCVTVRNLVPEPELFPTNSQYHAMYNFDYSVNGEERRNVDTYCGTWATQNALNWIKQQGTKPWLCYVPYHMPHSPHARPPLTHFDTGTWNCPLLQPPAQTGVGIVPYFKAACEALDYEVSRLTDGIVEYSADVYNNTIIFFFPDNGTTGEVLEHEVYPDDTPYLGTHGKRSCYEPGINVPLYIAGPTDIVSVDGGTDVLGLCHAVDLFQLIAELCGVVGVKDYMLNRKGVTLDSSPMFSTLSGTTTTVRQSVFSEIYVPNGAEGCASKIGQRAMLGNRYKLYRKATTSTGLAEFYDRIMDPQELDNLTPDGTSAGLTGSALAGFEKQDAAMKAFYASLPSSSA